MRYLRQVILTLAALMMATAAHADPTVLGSTHVQLSLPANTQVTVIAPSDNVHGAIVTSATLQTVWSAQGINSIDLQTASDGILIVSAEVVGAPAVVNLTYPIYLPAGVGLYAVANESGTAWITYQLN